VVTVYAVNEGNMTFRGMVYDKRTMHRCVGCMLNNPGENATCRHQRRCSATNAINSSPYIECRSIDEHQAARPTLSAAVAAVVRHGPLRTGRVVGSPETARSARGAAARTGNRPRDPAGVRHYELLRVPADRDAHVETGGEPTGQTSFITRSMAD
jgi:hypothetical protein